MTTVIALPRMIDRELAADIEKESAFVSPFLRSLSVSAGCDAVEFTASSHERQPEVADKVGRFLESMLRRIHRFDTKVFGRTERRDAGPFASGVQDELRRRGWLHEYGEGHVALFGPALALAQLVDRRAGELYAAAFGATPAMFPAFVDAEILRRCGYFDSHPNAVTMVGHIVEDFDAIETFRVANSCAEHAHLPMPEHVHMPGLCLNPAACFPCYPTLENRTIAGEGIAFTWQGRVFRYESRNVRGLERLWEFNVRELVFVGCEEYVVDCRRRALPLIGELAGMLDLECRIETAADPFFATVSAAKTFWQQAQEVKNEILLAIEPRADGTPRTLACGSVNLHGRFFGDRFNIAAVDGGPAFTGCIGIGIERWVLAAFTQHGFDPARWPAAARAEIFA